MALQRQLIPPFRYAIVEDAFFRGAYPTIKNFRFLRRLHLKTLVSLTPEAHPNRDMREFCDHEGIAVHNLFVDKFQGDGVTLTNAKVIQVLQILINPDNLPVYVHCLDGTHVTGVVVMCFRKLQSWNLSTSTAEFCQFEKDGEISREESQFVESFRGEIEVPELIPKWLWQGIRTVKHPSFRLRLLPTSPKPSRPETPKPAPVIFGEAQVARKRGVVKTPPPILALDRTERWSGPQAIVGFPRKGFREVHDRESRRSLEALSLEGMEVLGSSRRAPGWPRHVRRPPSSSSREKEVPQLVPTRTTASKSSSSSSSSREKEVPQFISTRTTASKSSSSSSSSREKEVPQFVSTRR